MSNLAVIKELENELNDTFGEEKMASFIRWFTFF